MDCKRVWFEGTPSGKPGSRLAQHQRTHITLGLSQSGRRLLDGILLYRARQILSRSVLKWGRPLRAAPFDEELWNDMNFADDGTRWSIANGAFHRYEKSKVWQCNL